MNNQVTTMRNHTYTKVEKCFRLFSAAVAGILLLSSLILLAIGLSNTLFASPDYTQAEDAFFSLDYCEEPDFEDTDTPICAYSSTDGEVTCLVKWTEERYVAAQKEGGFTANVYRDADGNKVGIFAENPTESDVQKAFRDLYSDGQAGVFSIAMALALSAVGVGVMAIFGVLFSTYEKIWFIGIMLLAALFSVLFPEEDCNGFSGILIMALYLADTFFNILCELLISKQSKWNFLVSVAVEIVEISICLVLAYRFATMAVTLFFWLPIDIVSFINWNRHPDRHGEEVTEVRRLRGWQEALVLSAIVLWTLGVGYLLTRIDLGTELFLGNDALQIAVCYLDACASAVGIANGLFIFFRYREQWVAWYIEALLETAINILSGQLVLLVLKFGYLSNSTYGYIRWTKYIKKHPEEKKSFL